MKTDLVLSIFPGIDLLGRAFESEGFCVVRGPDILWGGDIRDFHPPTETFKGVIGGPPCQDFSKARRTTTPPTGYGLEMLAEFARVITESRPAWFLMENVPTVPNISIAGYAVQRFDLTARDCGLEQNRLRHFQFGHRDGYIIIIERTARPHGQVQRCATASEGKHANRRTWSEFCQLQGLPTDFDLPNMSRTTKYQAVGNGVPIPMGRAIARAIQSARPAQGFRVCECGCGRPVGGRRVTATQACRKRLQRQRDTSNSHTAGQDTLFNESQ